MIKQSQFYRLGLFLLLLQVIIMFSKGFVRNLRFKARNVSISSRNLVSSRTVSSKGTSAPFRRITGAVGAISTALLVSHMTGSNEASCDMVDPFKGTAFYPQGKAFDKSTIQVSDLHTVSYSQYGNPKGKPVLFVHGGPGGGTDPSNVRFFDPSAYRVILVDQRGCGESKPFAELEENTTYDLVKDFEKIREKLGIEKWQVFGGSWGSTLALAYATEHPQRVTELVLRGIFLLADAELKWMYQGPGGSHIFPEDWEIYQNAIPEEERGDYIAAYGRRLRAELGEEEMRNAAKAWSIWEGRISKLVQDPWDKVKSKFGSDDFSLAFARIENHYFTNKGFFPRDDYLLEEEQLSKIRHIPTVIVQGRYDIVCPCYAAFKLKKGLPDAEIFYTLAGHSSTEKVNIEKLVYATDKFKSNK